MASPAPAVFPLEAVLRVLAESLPEDPISERTFLRQVLLDPNFRREGAILGMAGEEVAGFALALRRRVPLENAPDDSERGYLTLVGVRPAFRRRGIGSEMLDRAEAHLAEEGCRSVWIAPYAPGYFLPGPDVEVHELGIRILEARGYRVRYRPLAMEASLWRLETPDWIERRKMEHEVAGLRYLPFAPDLALPLLGFTRRCFPGDWVRVVREAMAWRPERLRVAVQAGEVVGFSHHRRERFGPIGVDPARRGEGIGQILMFETLRAQMAEGYRRSWFLWSDDRTAERLYAAAGFQEVRRFAVLSKDL
jgi:mycothiol synthase